VTFPGDTDRIVIVGTTGSGKTVAGMYHLSQRDLSSKVWIVYDFKRDELINSIKSAEHVSLAQPLPERPGVYVVHPRPGNEDLVDDHMFRIWERQDIGVYVDEGYMIGNRSPGFRALLTQGRTLHIPMIVLSQRPVFMDRFVFSESQYFQIFRLQHQDDIINTQKFVPYDLSKRLPRYHSYYYNAVDDRLVVLSPVPDTNAILDTFETKLYQHRKVV
jgi:hypothetical protein